LDDLKDFPEKVGHLRQHETFRGNWAAARAKERQFADSDPTVLIVGGGHCGLEISARLKYLGINSLIVEKNEKIGDNWRKRYEALSLHDQVCK
jgi:cation diffusion facilitator CzcD-associated flavoprotein CzcO